MSISGTGTAADPYVVDTWADFVTAVGTTDAYVVVNTTTVNTWDITKIVSGGITTAISWAAIDVEGNGITIKGLYGSNITNFFTTGAGTAQKSIRNINFLDMDKSATVTSFFNGKNIYFGGCKFSGIIDGGNFVSTSGTGVKIVFTTAVHDEEARGCSFSLQLKGSARFCSSDYCEIYHGNMNFIGASESTTAHKISMYESKITGLFPFISFNNAGGGQNVIDADISSIGTWSNTSGGVTLVNTDKLATGLSVPSGFTGVTSSQMLDVDALAAVGFTAYPEEEPEPEEPEETEGGEGE